MFPRQFFDGYWRPDLRNEVFVAMPFSQQFAAVWDSIIRPAVAEELGDLGLVPRRVDTTTISGSIVTEIMDGIAHARLIIADISITDTGDRNANVMYEVGLAHALRQPEEVLLLRQDNERISFDVAGLRVHRYAASDKATSRRHIGELCRACLREIDQTKAMKVQQAVESLDDACLTLIGQYHRGDHFSLGQQINMGQLLVGLPIRLGVFKLLELGIVRCHADGNQYAYHWTPFGRCVQRKLGMASKAV